MKALNKNKLNYYQKFVGSAQIDLKEATAGSLISFTLTYTVGKAGIDDGGSLKVLLRISADVPDVQFSNPNDNNYVDILSSNQRATLKGYSRKNGLKGKVHVRPWTNGFMIFVSNNYLSEGDKIFIKFKKWRIQTFLEKSFEFKLVIDPFATGDYIELKDNPSVAIKPGKPNNLVIIAPTTVNLNKLFTVLIKLEDKWGNPCIETHTLINIKVNSNLARLPSSIQVKGGIAQFKTKFNLGKFTQIEAEYNKIVAKSNPIVVVSEDEDCHYWSDLHGQAGETVGTNPIEEYIDFAKKYAKLDVICTQPNDFEVTNSYWLKINKLALKNTKSGSFLVFPGYEWSGNTDKGGDRNVIYRNTGNPIFRSSHALLEDYSDIDSDSLNVKELFKKLTNKKALTIAHVGGRYANLDLYDDSVEKAVEVHSNWGTFEWFLFDALERDYKVGIVSNSDTHNGRPGASYPGLEDVFNAYGGLTCILAPKLGSDDIFNSLLKRHFFATTGARIYLKTSYFADNKKIGMMGDIILPDNTPDKIYVNTVGTSFIEKLELFNKSKLIETLTPTSDSENSADVLSVKITWSGRVSNKGKDRVYPWDGSIEIENNTIKKIETLQIYDKRIINADKHKILINAFTSGNTQGVIVHLKKPKGKFIIKMNGKTIEVDIEAITTKNKIFYFGSKINMLKIYKTSASENSNYLTASFNLNKNNLQKNNAIFIKVTQRDGHMAWSSPLFFQT